MCRQRRSRMTLGEATLDGVRPEAPSTLYRPTLCQNHQPSVHSNRTTTNRHGRQITKISNGRRRSPPRMATPVPIAPIRDTVPPNQWRSKPLQMRQAGTAWRPCPGVTQCAQARGRGRLGMLDSAPSTILGLIWTKRISRSCNTAPRLNFVISRNSPRTVQTT